MTSFAALGLSAPIQEAINELGFETPSEIQERSIPSLIAEPSDFIGLAQTGTGKTAAFGLPLLEMTDPELPYIQGLILAPTRELGQQIADQIFKFSKHMKGLRTMAVYGGTPIVPQMKNLKKKPLHILIATPGRLIDLVNRRAVDLRNVEVVVLDEADEMLNMGFRDDLNTILDFTPKEKLTWLFSATMPNDIRKMVGDYMENPLEVKVSPKNIVNKNIEHQYVIVRASDKTAALRRILDNDGDLYGVVFCRTKRDTQQVADSLADAGYPVEALHGDLSQSQRTMVMKRFKSGNIPVLVATDVAARGIDVDDLTHVIHYALPDDNEYYTHRSGRTARAGKKGISLALATKGDMRKVKMLESKLKIKMEKVEVPTADKVLGNKVEQWAARVADHGVAKMITPELLERAESKLAQVDRTELVMKLLSMELKSIGYGDSNKDLNERGPIRDRDDSDRRRGGKRDQTSSGFHRFFINIGSMDNCNKGDLLRFVCDQASLTKADIGVIKVFDKHSTFEVSKRISEKIPQRFRGVTVNDRPLRVNRDDDDRGNRKPWGAGGGKKGGGGHHKRRRRN